MIRLLLIIALLLQPLAAMREATMVCVVAAGPEPTVRDVGACCGESAGCCGDAAEPGCCESRAPGGRWCAEGVSDECCAARLICCCDPVPAGAPERPLGLPSPVPDLSAVLASATSSYPSLAAPRSGRCPSGTERAFELRVGERLARLCVRTT